MQDLGNVNVASEVSEHDLPNNSIKGVDNVNEKATQQHARYCAPNQGASSGCARACQCLYAATRRI
eukprot:942231-Lingulodinium_polyedra.AAC.1